jgi:Holliday junction resolvase
MIMMDKNDIAKLAQYLYPNLIRSDLESADVDALAAKIKEMRVGWSPEDEFAATMCWLGNSAGFHRITEVPAKWPPELAEKMRAPDFLAFPIVDGRPFPVLIEVKSSRHQQIKWSAKYRRSLIAFAEQLKLPLLVAWKHYGLWLVVDHRHFRQNQTGYRLDMETAFREDLSCVLFRNLRIQMNPDLRFVLHMEILDEMPGGTDTLLPEGTITFEIKRAAFYVGETQLQDKAPSFAFSLLLATADQAELKRTGKQTCEQIFRPLENHGFSLSSVFVAQVSLRSTGEEVDWHRELTTPPPSSGLQLRESLNDGIKQKFVRYVMDVVPNTWPEFLPALAKTPRT